MLLLEGGQLVGEGLILVGDGLQVDFNGGAVVPGSKGAGLLQVRVIAD